MVIDKDERMSHFYVKFCKSYKNFIYWKSKRKVQIYRNCNGAYQKQGFWGKPGTWHAEIKYTVSHHPGCDSTNQQWTYCMWADSQQSHATNSSTVSPARSEMKWPGISLAGLRAIQKLKTQQGHLKNRWTPGLKHKLKKNYEKNRENELNCSSLTSNPQ